MNLFSGFNLLLILLGFGLLIFVHELGHFLAAKWAGIKVTQFAIGFGRPILAWRKGVGLRWSSTEPEVRQRVSDSMARQDREGSQFREKSSKQRELSSAEIDRLAASQGIGETEYRLNWLPLGGYVKMLGQEDLNPEAVSDDPRSYGRCPVGRRMVVVSAGVIANLILAVILFIIAFMIGVRFPDAVVGNVISSLPAATTWPDNAAALGVSEPGLRPGDRALSINGKAATSFMDLELASAMSKPGDTLRLVVERSGLDAPLQFSMTPKVNPTTDLLSLGIMPGSSTTLLADDDQQSLHKLLEQIGLAQQGVRPGMKLLAVNGQPISTYGEFHHAVETGDGQPINSTWSAVDKAGEATGAEIDATISVRPSYEILQQPAIPGAASATAVSDFGLLGMTPLVRVERVDKKSPNVNRLRAGDVFFRVGSVYFPRQSQLTAELARHKGDGVQLEVFRDGEVVELVGEVNSDGLLQIVPGLADDLPRTADPIEQLANGSNGHESKAGPAAALNVMPGSWLIAVDDIETSNWPEIRAALRQRTAAAFADGTGATVRLTLAHPTPGVPRESAELHLSSDDVKALHELGWQTALLSDLFEPLYALRSAGGNPIRAVVMGFEETYKLVVLTYLTIDRLFRGSVGVKQLHGPVGIVHLGTKIADRGFTYMIFFLAIISVNLAVINFLPLPIMDGGLFLFLIYEKFKGQPPSIAFQNAATVVGLVLLGSIFVITFYNDIVRLMS